MRTCIPACVQGGLRRVVLLGRWGLAGLLITCGVAAVAVPSSSAPSVLRLHDSAGNLDPGPFLSHWSDPGGRADMDEVLRQRAAFKSPAGARRAGRSPEEILWLRLPLQVPVGDPLHWVLSVDHAERASIDYYLVSDGLVLDHQRLDPRMLLTERTLPRAGHTVRLDLQPGGDYEVFLRVRRLGAWVGELPLRLWREPQLQVHESRLQVQIGLLLGLALVLLVCCVRHGVQLGEPLFLLYAVQLLLLGGALGITRGALGRYLVPDDPWWAVNGAPLLRMLALSTACGFIDRLLHLPTLQRGCSHVLRAMAGIGVLAVLLLRVGVIDLVGLDHTFMVIGAVSVGLGAYGAWLRWRQGDRVAGWLLLERVVQCGGMWATMGVLQGHWPIPHFTQDLDLWMSLLAMGLWARALVLRAHGLLDARQMAQADRAHLPALAHTDALTGLMNRHGLQEALAQTLPKAGPNRQLAVYVLDLDGFRAIHSAQGQTVGDTLLVAVAQRLRACLRTGDIVARQGSNQFIVAAVDLPHTTAAASIGRVLQQQFDVPFMLPKAQCRLGVTIGYALAPEDGNDLQSLLNAADTAFYGGKRDGNALRPLAHTQRLRRGRAVRFTSTPVSLPE